MQNTAQRMNRILYPAKLILKNKNYRCFKYLRIHGILFSWTLIKKTTREKFSVNQDMTGGTTAKRLVVTLKCTLNCAIKNNTSCCL